MPGPMNRLLLVLPMLACLSSATAEVLDPDFGTNGQVLNSIPGTYQEAFDLELMADGRFVTVGRYGPNGASLISATRYMTDGSLDSTYGSYGVATTTITGNDWSLCGALRPDGRVLVAGQTSITTADDAYVVRFNPDGSLDTGFADAGKYIFSQFNAGTINCMVMRTDGGVVVGGEVGLPTSPSNAFIASLDANGTLDSTFGDNGIFLSPFMGGLAKVRALTLDSLGRVVFTGMTSAPAPINGTWLMGRLTSSGTLDSTFNTDGYTTYDLTGSEESGWSVAVQPDSMILTGGRVKHGNVDTRMAMWRIHPNSLFDQTWGSSGMATFWTGMYANEIYDIELQPDGKIVWAGTVHHPGIYQAGFIGRSMQDGQLDTTFGTSGYLLVDGLSASVRLYGLAIQPDEKLLVAGQQLAGSQLSTILQRYGTSIPTNMPASAQKDTPWVHATGPDRLLIGGCTGHITRVLFYGTDGRSHGTGTVLGTGPGPLTVLPSGPLPHGIVLVRCEGNDVPLVLRAYIPDR